MKSIFRKSKKGNTAIQQAPSLIMALVIIGIVGAIGLSVIVGVGSAFTANSVEANATVQATTAISNFYALLPVLGTVFIAIILLGAVMLLAMYGYGKYR